MSLEWEILKWSPQFLLLCAVSVASEVLCNVENVAQSHIFTDGQIIVLVETPVFFF